MNKHRWSGLASVVIGAMWIELTNGRGQKSLLGLVGGILLILAGIVTLLRAPRATPPST